MEGFFIAIAIGALVLVVIFGRRSQYDMLCDQLIDELMGHDHHLEPFIPSKSVEDLIPDGVSADHFYLTWKKNGGGIKASSKYVITEVSAMALRELDKGQQGKG
jgi:hypothetical protein